MLANILHSPVQSTQYTHLYFFSLVFLGTNYIYNSEGDKILLHIISVSQAATLMKVSVQSHC